MRADQMNRSIAECHNGDGRKSAPSRGHETGSQPPIDRPNDLSRAPNAAPGKSAPREGPPGVSFICTKGGAGWSRPRPAHKPSPKFPVGGPAPIFWPNFLGKNFGNKNRIPEERVLRVVPF